MAGGETLPADLVLFSVGVRPSSRLAVEGGYVSREGANAWRPRQTRRKVWPVVTAVVVALAIASPTLKEWGAFQKRKMDSMQKGGR